MASGPHPTATTATAVSSAAPSAGGSSSGDDHDDDHDGRILIGDRLCRKFAHHRSLADSGGAALAHPFHAGQARRSETDLRVWAASSSGPPAFSPASAGQLIRPRADRRASPPRLHLRCLPVLPGPGRVGGHPEVLQPRVAARAREGACDGRTAQELFAVGRGGVSGGTKWRRRLVRARLTPTLPFSSLVCRWRWQRVRCCFIVFLLQVFRQPYSFEVSRAGAGDGDFSIRKWEGRRG